jgi:hypothetical protein
MIIFMSKLQLLLVKQGAENLDGATLILSETLASV